MKIIFLMLLFFSTAFASQNKMSEEDKRTLKIGELSPGRYFAGGLLSWAPGFGVGQAVQGRWSDQGYIYTAGEIFSLVFIMVESADYKCSDAKKSNLNCYLDDSKKNLSAGAALFLLFKTFEIWDAWVGGFRHMDRYDELKKKQVSMDLTMPKNDSLMLALNYQF